MLVKCKICGKKIDRDTAYKIVLTRPSGTVNMYYCSKEEYEKKENEKKYFKECQYLIDRLFGEVVVDNSKNKMLSELHKAGYSYEMIYNCMEDNSAKIENALVIKRNDFNGSMYNKLAYVFGIVRKEINRYEHNDIDKKINKDVIDESEMEKTKRKELKRTKCLMDILKGGKNE